MAGMARCHGSHGSLARTLSKLVLNLPLFCIILNYAFLCYFFRCLEYTIHDKEMRDTREKLDLVS